MISFHDWIFSVYPPNSKIEGAWGPLHIVTMLLIVGAIVGFTFLFGKKSDKTKRTLLFVIVGILFAFELARRIIGFCSGVEMDFTKVMRTLLPRPWCAISVWMLMISVVVNKKFFYNFTASSAILCTIIFFAYPTVGFNNKYILFENLYSICTHALLMMGAFLLITLNFTDFDFKAGVWKEGICLATITAYTFLQIFVLQIEKDPMYFMPNGEIQEILSMDYPVYVVGYVLFLAVYFTAYYVVPYFIAKNKAKSVVESNEQVEND